MPAALQSFFFRPFEPTLKGVIPSLDCRVMRWHLVFSLLRRPCQQPMITLHSTPCVCSIPRPLLTLNNHLQHSTILHIFQQCFTAHHRHTATTHPHVQKIHDRG